MPNPLSRSLAVLVALGLSACAPAAPPAPAPAPAPPPATAAPAPPALAPDPALVRAAERVQLTGTELGTMWTFENPPLEYWESTYGFRATPEWLEKVRLSSVRYGEICSASFVSPRGLVMTNHHCARDCIEAVSTESRDYVVNGFYARTRQEELLCPDLFLDQLVEIEDVTERVGAAAAPGEEDTRVAAAQEAEREEIEQECEARTEYECQVVTLFHGGQHMLYRYRRFAPVKLVFAPELQAGFYGGDPDNFTYPRYALDVSFVRAYAEDGTTPAATPNHFAWDADGAAEGELVFITGNPGSTNRLATVAELLYEQRLNHPLIVQFLEGQRAVLQEIAREGPEAERRVRDQLFGVENSLKAYSGQLGGLRDTTLFARKVRWEREFRDRVEADPALRAEYGDVWDRIAEVQARKLRLQPTLQLNNPNFAAAPHLDLAVQLVLALGGNADPALRERILTAEPPDADLSRRMLRLRLELARAWLPADASLLREALRPGESPAQAAERLVRESRVGDAEFRRSALAGGASPDALGDPLVALAARMIASYREVVPAWQELTAGEEVQRSRLARALFGVYGTRLPPDATFTLRISDGVVRGYPFNGTVAPPKTTYYGLFERAANFDGAMPWTLPEAFARNRARIDLAVPLNFVTTNDITGGNSGSPMIDREARVVGLAFDSNIEGLPNEFLFTTGAARTVGVHSAGILEALRNAYGAAALVSELTGR